MTRTAPSSPGRPPLPAAEIERIRRERLVPRPTQWDYLHLRALLRTLRSVLASRGIEQGPLLDLFCGTMPYRELVPLESSWGYDIDMHFGAADVIGGTSLPFRDASFGLILCTQALHLVVDPEETVREVRRVLVPGGQVVASVPSIFRRELPYERKWAAADLRALFGEWSDVEVRCAGGPGTGAAFVTGSLLRGACRRLGLERHVLPLLSLPLNAMGAVVDLVPGSIHQRWPASLVLSARRPRAGN